MKAVTCPRYGPPDVLELRDVPAPRPRADEVLVRVYATTVTSGDVRIRSATYAPWFRLPARLMFGIRGPRQPVPGSELAGVVESVGADVVRFSPGERVFGLPWVLGFGGTCAEYVCLPQEGMVATVPDGVSLDAAAALPVGGLTALHLLRSAGIAEGQRVLVHGASGSVGTYAVQLARRAGATVTGVCSTRNVDLVRSLGTHSVIDYTKEDPFNPGRRYDIVVDAVMRAPFARCRQILQPQGCYATVDFPLMTVFGEKLKRGSRRIVWGTADKRPADLAHLAGLVADGSLVPIIDRAYPMADVADAHAYVDTGRKVGNVVIHVA